MSWPEAFVAMIGSIMGAFTLVTIFICATIMTDDGAVVRVINSIKKKDKKDEV